jgi:hypothetical protein
MRKKGSKFSGDTCPSTVFANLDAINNTSILKSLLNRLALSFNGNR